MPLNHPCQSPSYYGRYPRSMEEAFGTGAKLDVDPDTRVQYWSWVIAAVLVVCYFMERMS